MSSHLLIEYRSLGSSLRAHGVAGIARTLRAVGVAGLAIRLGDLIDSELDALLKGARDGDLDTMIVTARIDVRQSVLDPRIEQVCAMLPSQRSIIELQLVSSGAHDAPSAPRADSAACNAIRRLLDLTHERQALVAIRPDSDAWLRRIDHAVRLAMRINRPRLGLTLDLPTWRTAGESDMNPMLDLATPRLWNVVGDSSSSNSADSVAVVAHGLRARGYTGCYTLAIPSVIDDEPKLNRAVATAMRIVSGGG